MRVIPAEEEKEPQVLSEVQVTKVLITEKGEEEDKKEEKEDKEESSVIKFLKSSKEFTTQLKEYMSDCIKNKDFHAFKQAQDLLESVINNLKPILKELKHDKEC